MNTTRSLTVALPLLCLPLLAFHLKVDDMSFHPEEGSTVSKEMTFETTFYIDDLSVTMDGQELPAEAMAQAMEEGLLINAVIGCTDEYVKIGDGRALTLLRTYDELSLEAGPESQAETQDEFSDLEDSTVEFKWDEEEGEYIKTYHESSGDEDLLENLDIDMDFLRLLPDGEVDVDDTWEVKGDGLESIFFPGGVPAGSPSDAEAEEMAELFQEEMEAQFEEAFKDFVIQCKYIGAREDGEMKVGEVEFKYEGNASFDLSELIQEVIDRQAGEMGIEAEVVATIDMEFEGEGTLLWDLASGHVSEFEMKGDITVIADVEADVDAMGEQHSMVMAAEVSGEATWGLEATGDGE